MSGRNFIFTLACLCALQTAVGAERDGTSARSDQNLSDLPVLRPDLRSGVTLEARRPVRFQVIQPLTGAAVSNLTLNGGERFTLAQGPGTYILKGTFPSRPRGTAQVEETRPKPLKP